MAADMTIVLYDLVGQDPKRPFSPHCWKAAMALAHKGLDWRSHPVRFTEVPFLEDGASKTVPLIRDGETLVADSFAIARYLDAAYPDAPSLFIGEAGEAHARFIERWSQTMLHPALSHIAILDIVKALDPEDAAYFRASREKRFGRSLEDVAADAEAKTAELRRNLEPLRSMLAYQPFIGGEGPLFADYIVLGAFQWVRAVSGQVPLDDADPLHAWLDRCLDLHGGLARRLVAV
jgi:glutathione S-transferase